MNSHQLLIVINRIIKLALFSLLLVFTACNEEVTYLRIIYSSDEPIGLLSKQVKKIADREPSLTAELIIGRGSIANVDSLLFDRADLAIIENHTPIDSGVSAILPFYPQILHILYQSDSAITDFKHLVKGKTLFIGEKGSGTYRFMMNLFDFYGINKLRVKLVDSPFECEVYCAFGDVISDDNLEGMDDFRLYSFDDVSLQGKGSIADAICLKYPQMKTFIIPKHTYRALTPKAVLTIAVDAVLVARTGLSEEVIHTLTKAIFQNHQEFYQISPLIYLDLTEKFEFTRLNYPLHPGARRYLDRDEPSFFERYAELFGVTFSLIFAFVSGLVSLAKWRNQTKKDRIDVFYKEIIEVKKIIPSLSTIKECKLKIQKLQKEQDKAFQMLIDEELQANESFRIYMELNKEILQSLVVRTKSLMKKAQA